MGGSSRQRPAGRLWGADAHPHSPRTSLAVSKRAQGKETQMVACASLPNSGVRDGGCFTAIQGAPLKYKDYSYWCGWLS